MNNNKVHRLTGILRKEGSEGVLNLLIKSFQNGRTKESICIYQNSDGLVSHVTIKYHKKPGST